VVTDQLYSQSEFEFFDRATWTHYGTMKIDDVDNSAGVASFPFPVPGFPMGIFATTNDDNSVVLVSWEKIFTQIQINTTLPKVLSSLTEEIPTEYSLRQNYPNPFNPSTKIRYQLPKESKVIIKIYDILGSEVITLLNEKKEPGVYEVDFNAQQLSSGTYIYRIIAGSFAETKKMVLKKYNAY